MRRHPLCTRAGIVRTVALILAVAAIAANLPQAAPTAQAVSANLVISQVYGAGGNAGATLNADYVEIFNRGSSTVSLSGLSIQYASATGTGLFAGNPIVVLPSAASLAPGHYFLVGMDPGSNGAALPTPDATDTIALDEIAGKVILANTTTGLACNGSAGQPCSGAQLAQIIDLVGYGPANFSEGSSPAGAPSTTTADIRNGGGCIDTDFNSADFTVAAPTPRNTSSTLAPCGPVADTPTPSITPTPTVTQTVTETPTATPTVTETPTQTMTATPAITTTPTATGTGALAPSSTPTQTATSTQTSTPAQTLTATPSPSSTATITPSATPTLVVTVEAVATGGPTASPTSSPTAAGSGAITLTLTPTLTPTATTVPGANDANQDTSTKKASEDDKRQQGATNRSNRDDVHTEGNVISVRVVEGGIVIRIALGRAEEQDIVISCAGPDCPTVPVGSYLEINGTKEHEELFYGELDSLKLSR